MRTAADMTNGYSTASEAGKSSATSFLKSNPRKSILSTK
ncbi:hypothetical protein EVA_12958 [gut metagenome]|uniref:Uncharacterized protein n=1 Tax=gut metagenome TaxID=749906 RepID=J9GAX9_9ZZZZ